MKKISKAVVGIAAAGLLVSGIGISAAAANASAPASVTAAKAIPGPVAAVPALTGCDRTKSEAGRRAILALKARLEYRHTRSIFLFREYSPASHVGVFT